MPKKTINKAIKILLIILLIGAVGVGVWQFNIRYTISKKASISQLNKDIESLKKQTEEQQAKIKQLEALNSVYYESWLKDVPETTTKTVPTLPKFTDCHWVGNTWSCTSY